MMEIKEIIVKCLRELDVFDKVNFIMLYGSKANGKDNPMSDIDIGISVNMPKKERGRLRVRLLGELPKKYDIQIFDDLPLRIKMSVLRGKLLYCKDKDKLTDTAIRLKKEYEDFLPRYNYYITGIKHGERASI